MKSHKSAKRGYSFIMMASGLVCTLILLCYTIFYANFVRTADPEDGPIIIPDDDDFSIPFINDRLMGNIETLYVIPGGGSSSDDVAGYPEWTKQRVVAAYQHYSTKYRSDTSNEQASNKNVIHESNHPAQAGAVFVALSAGSMNAPNVRYEDNRIKFECQHVIQHLKDLGIPQDIIFGDMLSWDTVTNGLTLRMTVEAILLYRKKSHDLGTKHSASIDHTPLLVEVFISDFHAARVQAAFEWVLGLKPSIGNIELRINSVSSKGIAWQDSVDFNQRLQHEQDGVNRIMKNSRSIKTMAQFYSFLMLGGHQGMHKYLHGTYVASTGGGW